MSTPGLLRQLQPRYLLLAALTYALGVGISKYLGATLKWPEFLLGLLIVLALQAAAFLLLRLFRLPWLPLAPEERPAQREQERIRLLVVACACLGLTCIAVVTLLLTGSLHLEAGLLLCLSALLLVFFSIHPFRLADAGYGEFLLAVQVATFVPALGYLLQSSALHRLLLLTSFPLTMLALGWLLAANFSSFAADQKLGYRTLLIRLTWQRAVPVHHLLVLSAFLGFASAPALGVSWGLIWPVFLAFPFAILQIFWLQRIASGGTPVWKFFDLLTVSVFGLSAYLLALAFWMR